MSVRITRHLYGFCRSPRLRRLAPAALVGAAGLSLAACATDQVGIQTATNLSAATSQTATQAKSYLSTVQQRRTDANIALVASDISCSWGSGVFIHTPTDAEIASGKHIPLCTDHPTPSDHLYTLRPVSVDQLKPTMSLVGAVADYAAAMDKILSVKAPDVTAELTSLNGDANTAKNVVNTLSKAGIKNPLSASQLSAAGKLIEVFTDLQHEASTAKDLKALTAKEDAKVDQAIDELKKQIQAWQTGSVEGDDQVAVVAMERAMRSAGASWDFNARRSFLTTLASAQADISSSDDAAAALVDALSKVEASQADLHNVLLGNLTPDEKKQKAEFGRQDIVQAFDAIIGAVEAL